MVASPVYEEIIDFLAAGTTPDSLVAFRPSEAAKQRVEELIRREKSASLSTEETAELTHYMQLEHIMRLAKARTPVSQEMSTTYINAQLRRHVVRRADQLCEYCLIHDDDTYWGCQIDRLIERQELQALGRYPMKEALALIEG